MGLGDGGGSVEPVERLGDRDPVEPAGREGKTLRPGRHHRHRGRRPPELGDHARHRLGGQHPRAGRAQGSGELAGPGGQVEHPGRGAQPELAGDEADRIGGVAGTAPLVDLTGLGRPPRGGVAAHPSSDQTSSG